MTEVKVAPADLADPQVTALAEAHQRGMLAVSPPGTSFALDVSGLQGPGITLFGAWLGDDLAAIGALKRLGDGHAEIKSMRTKAEHTAKGAATAILDAIIDAARREGIGRLSLETGTGEAFAPAMRLYARHGFRAGPAFAGYTNGPHNQCYHLSL